MPKNDDLDDFLKRQKSFAKDAAPLENRAEKLMVQTDQLVKLFDAAATLIGEAAEKDKTDGVTGSTLKEFESAKYVKAEMEEVAKIVASARKTEKNAEEIVDDAQAVQKGLGQLIKDIDAYLKAHKGAVEASDQKALQTVRKDAERLHDRLDSLVIQPANANVQSPDSHLKSFRKKADGQVAKARIPKEIEAQREKDEYRFDKRIVMKAMGEAKRLQTDFDDEEDTCRGQIIKITTDAGAKAKAQKSLATCEKLHEEISEIAMDYRRHMASLDKATLERLHAMQDYKKTQELLKYIDATVTTQSKTIQSLTSGISHPPPPKNPVPAGGLKK